MRQTVAVTCALLLAASSAGAQSILNGGHALNSGGATLQRVETAPDAAPEAPHVAAQPVAPRYKGPVKDLETALSAALAAGQPWDDLLEALLEEDTSSAEMRRDRAMQAATATLLLATGPGPKPYTEDGVLPADALFGLFGPGGTR